MTRLRAFQREDIPQVVELFETAFIESGKRVPSGLDTYFERVFFENPLNEADLPSFVYLDGGGAIVGFVGVQPRRLLLRGRRLRAIGARDMRGA